MSKARAFGWWLLVLAVLAASTITAYFAFWLSIAFDQATLPLVASAHFNFPPSDLLHVTDLISMLLVIGIWIVPTAWAVGFAMRARTAIALLWGLSISLLLTAVFLCYMTHPFSRAFGIAAGVAAICGIVLLVIRKLPARAILLVEVASLLLLLAPSLIVLASAQRQPPSARKIWSVVLQKGTWLAMNTDDFGATRQLTFAGDRIIAVFDAGSAGYQGKEPMSKYRVLSLDRDTGAIQDQIEFTGPWGAMPYVFGTSRSKVVLIAFGPAEVLNPDLSKTGIELNYKGRIDQISPDGSRLGWETFPGMTLLSTDTLQPIAKLSESSPGSISQSAALSAEVRWDQSRSGETYTVEKVGEKARRFMFPGDCGFPGQFLTADRLLITGCGKIYILDTLGDIVIEKKTAETGKFAGVSQNQKRFALEFNDERGDPEVLLYEQFVIYDSATAAPVASVLMDSLPKRQSWSAFSPDGRYFAVGNPNKLTLYSIP